LDELDNVIGNKARLVTKGFTQVKRIDFEEIFATVERLEAIWLTHAYASFKNFKLL